MLQIDFCFELLQISHRRLHHGVQANFNDIHDVQCNVIHVATTAGYFSQNTSNHAT